MLLYYRFYLFVVLFSSLLASLPALAQSNPQPSIEARLAAPALTARPISGVVAAASGETRIITISDTGDSIGRIAGVGTPVYLNDEIRTGENTQLQILLQDQTVFSLGSNAVIVFDEFIYDPGNDDFALSAKVSRGVFKFISGKIADHRPEAMTIKLPNATASIRGTTVAGRVDDDGSSQIILLSGAISITSDTNPEPVDIFQSGWGTMISNEGAVEPPAAVPPATLDTILDAVKIKISENADSEQADASSDDDGDAGQQQQKTDDTDGDGKAESQQFAEQKSDDEKKENTTLDNAKSNNATLDNKESEEQKKEDTQPLAEEKTNTPKPDNAPLAEAKTDEVKPLTVNTQQAIAVKDDDKSQALQAPSQGLAAPALVPTSPQLAAVNTVKFDEPKLETQEFNTQEFDAQGSDTVTFDEPKFAELSLDEKPVDVVTFDAQEFDTVTFDESKFDTVKPEDVASTPLPSLPSLPPLTVPSADTPQVNDEKTNEEKSNINGADKADSPVVLDDGKNAQVQSAPPQQAPAGDSQQPINAPKTTPQHGGDDAKLADDKGTQQQPDDVKLADNTPPQPQPINQDNGDGKASDTTPPQQPDDAKKDEPQPTQPLPDDKPIQTQPDDAKPVDDKPTQGAVSDTKSAGQQDDKPTEPQQPQPDDTKLADDKNAQPQPDDTKLADNTPTQPQVGDDAKKDEPQPTQPQPDDKPIQTQPDDKPIQTQPDDKPIQTQPDDKPIQTQPDDAKPVDDKPTQGVVGDTKPAGQDSTQGNPINQDNGDDGKNPDSQSSNKDSSNVDSSNKDSSNDKMGDTGLADKAPDLPQPPPQPSLPQPDDLTILDEPKIPDTPKTPGDTLQPDPIAPDSIAPDPQPSLATLLAEQAPLYASIISDGQGGYRLGNPYDDKDHPQYNQFNQALGETQNSYADLLSPLYSGSVSFSRSGLAASLGTLTTPVPSYYDPSGLAQFTTSQTGSASFDYTVNVNYDTTAVSGSLTVNDLILGEGQFGTSTHTIDLANMGEHFDINGGLAHGVPLLDGAIINGDKDLQASVSFSGSFGSISDGTPAATLDGTLANFGLSIYDLDAPEYAQISPDTSVAYSFIDAEGKPIHFDAKDWSFDASQNQFTHTSGQIVNLSGLIAVDKNGNALDSTISYDTSGTPLSLDINGESYIYEGDPSGHIFRNDKGEVVQAHEAVQIPTLKAEDSQQGVRE